jgi:dihydrofolate synthase/folylpolyglutamate synthase
VGAHIVRAPRPAAPSADRRGAADPPGSAGSAAVEEFESIAQAYRAALERAGPDDRIVVFGSFLTVSDVMRSRT